MKTKFLYCLNGVAIYLACFLAIAGCVNTTADGEGISQKEATGQGQESGIVLLIEQGEDSFLLPMEDGYLYPVTVPDPLFIETMPLQIEIRFHHQQRNAVVVVEILQLLQFLPGEAVPVEVWLDDRWHVLHGAHRFQGQFLGQQGSDTGWQSFPDEIIRIKIIEGT